MRASASSVDGVVSSGEDALLEHATDALRRRVLQHGEVRVRRVAVAAGRVGERLERGVVECADAIECARRPQYEPAYGPGVLEVHRVVELSRQRAAERALRVARAARRRAERGLQRREPQVCVLVRQRHRRRALAHVVQRLPERAHVRHGAVLPAQRLQQRRGGGEAARSRERADGIATVARRKKNATFS